LPEWLIERGIGETRAVLVEHGEIVESRIELDGVIPAGSVVHARLVNNGTNGRNAIAIAEGGTEYLLPRGAPGVTQGATLNIEVTREGAPGRSRGNCRLAAPRTMNPIYFRRSRNGLAEGTWPSPAHLMNWEVWVGAI